MKYIKSIAISLVILATIEAKAQLNYASPSLKKYEIALLDILSKDSIHPLSLSLIHISEPTRPY